MRFSSPLSLAWVWPTACPLPTLSLLLILPDPYSGCPVPLPPPALSLLPLLHPDVSQNDQHFGELTVRETLDFSARCQASRTRKSESCSAAMPGLACLRAVMGWAGKGGKAGRAWQAGLEVLLHER